MCDTVFAFGERDSYYFECPSRWCYNGLPEPVAVLFAEGIVRETYHLSLGTNGAFIFSYKSKSNKVSILIKNIPERLEAWLYKKDADGDCVRNFQCLYACLRPDNKGFWATDRRSSIWDGLPAGLTFVFHKLLKDGQWTDTPRLVTLGVGDNYLMLTKADACYWYLDNYGSLNSQIPTLRDNRAFHIIRNLMLNAHKSGAFALVFATGASFAEGMPASATENMQAMHKAIKEDSAILEQQKHQQQLQTLWESKRMMELLNQASALGDLRSAHAAQNATFMNNLGYECADCGRNPAYCVCSNI
ncbi:hypothetical protein FALCPG4_015055 [Fusarium falciforme]